MARQLRPGQLQTGSLYNISSSYSITASYSLNAGTTIDTSLFVTTASFTQFTSSIQQQVNSLTSATSSYVLGSQTSSMSVLSSSFSTTSSYSLQSISASYAPFVATDTGSLLTTASISNATITFTKGNGTTFPVTVNNVASSSYALSASQSQNATSSSFAVTASHLTGYVSPFPFTGSAIISGSLTVTGSTNFQGTAGSTIFLTNADTLVITGSLLVTGSVNVVGLITGTASFANQALSSSFATTAQTASYYNETDPIFVAKSASFATTGSNTFIGNQIISGSLTIETGKFITGSLLGTASFALTASYIDGGFY